ncbi:MAG: hypothetical protein ABFD89_03830 [Bryobacteraceae bacterium]
MADISCQQFTDLLSRRTEHLDDEILRDLTPATTLVGYVQTGSFRAEDGTSHTFDKFNRVYPDLSKAWSDVQAGSCIGQPCDPEEVRIGMGFTRDMYKLQQISYDTDIYCYDLIMSADRAKEQFSHTISNLRDATEIINSNRIRNEMFRIAGHHWITTMTGLVPFTFAENGTDLIDVDVSQLPDSKLVPNMLRTRVAYHALSGYLGKTVKNVPPKIEVLTDMEEVWHLTKGDTTVADHWRFEAFDPDSKEFREYGWAGQMGNFMLHADLSPIRFEIVGPTKLRRVFPYVNISATQGIKGVVNQAYIDAPVQASFIWHRRAMLNRMRDTTSINPQMPFAARNYGGKWQFVMDNLSCGYSIGTDANGQQVRVPIMVPNPRRNKGKFIADFSYATEAQFPEYAEVFLHLREQPCIVGEPLCSTPYYVEQDYSSHNEPCPDPVIEQA